MHELMEFLSLKRLMAAILDLAAILKKESLPLTLIMNLCVKFHACMIKCTHHPVFSTILLDYNGRSASNDQLVQEAPGYIIQFYNCH